MVATLNEVETEPGIMHLPSELDGDTKVSWNRRNEGEVAEALATFERYRSKGYAAYKTTKEGEKGEVINSFDPTSERITFMPPQVGG